MSGYILCIRCGGRFFGGDLRKNNPKPARCGVCEPRDTGIDWAKVPNLRVLSTSDRES